MGRFSEELKDSQVLVIGLGLSGRAAASFLLQNGAFVEATDDNKEALSHEQTIDLISHGLRVISLQSSYTIPDFVVVSPGVLPSHPFVLLAQNKGWEIIGEMELGCRYLSNPMVAVTGTNGKTTVALLTAHILETFGLPARAVGNIGTPVTGLLDKSAQLKAQEILVVELSSFQLETLNIACFESGVLLNITPDHLDRYGSFKEYADAKFHLKKCIKNERLFYIGESCANQFSFNAEVYGYSSNLALYTDLFYVYFCGEKVFELPVELQGRVSHETENLMAAYCLCRFFGISGERFIEGYKTFKKPSHRIEFVRTCNGVHYVNDSKGTNLDAVMKAVNFLEGTIILIAGGIDKGASYRPWVESFQGKVKKICVIGQAAKKIHLELNEDISTSVYTTLEEAVCAAASDALQGETILLSPGCASFDMFRDYAHRGDEFKRIVLAL